VVQVDRQGYALTLPEPSLALNRSGHHRSHGALRNCGLHPQCAHHQLRPGGAAIHA
jgi:hypothetical protein